MIILSRKELIDSLWAKINVLDDDELVELYEKAYDVTPVIRELVNEQYIEREIWDETHVTVTVQETEEGVEIIPDSYQELADYWCVDVDSNEFWDNMEKWEKYWDERIGKEIKQ